MSKSKGLATAAYYAGQAAKNDERIRLVPEKWAGYEEEWLAGYDGKDHIR